MASLHRSIPFRLPCPPSCAHVRSTLVVMWPTLPLAPILLQWPSVNFSSAFCSQSHSDPPRSLLCSFSLALRPHAARRPSLSANHPANSPGLPTSCRARDITLRLLLTASC